MNARNAVLPPRSLVRSPRTWLSSVLRGLAERRRRHALGGRLRDRELLDERLHQRLVVGLRDPAAVLGRLRVDEQAVLAHELALGIVEIGRVEERVELLVVPASRRASRAPRRGRGRASTSSSSTASRSSCELRPLPPSAFSARHAFALGVELLRERPHLPGRIGAGLGPELLDASRGVTGGRLRRVRRRDFGRRRSSASRASAVALRPREVSADADDREEAQDHEHHASCATSRAAAARAPRRLRPTVSQGAARHGRPAPRAWPASRRAAPTPPASAGITTGAIRRRGLRRHDHRTLSDAAGVTGITTGRAEAAGVTGMTTGGTGGGAASVRGTVTDSPHFLHLKRAPSRSFGTW